MKFPGSFHIIHSSNYWSNEPILIDYLKKLIFPYLEKKMQRFKTGEKCKGATLLIFDVLKGQATSVVKELLQKIDIVVIHVPINYKNLFQPFDNLD